MRFRAPVRETQIPRTQKLLKMTQSAPPPKFPGNNSGSTKKNPQKYIFHILELFLRNPGELGLSHWRPESQWQPLQLRFADHFLHVLFPFFALLPSSSPQSISFLKPCSSWSSKGKASGALLWQGVWRGLPQRRKRNLHRSAPVWFSGAVQAVPVFSSGSSFGDRAFLCFSTVYLERTVPVSVPGKQFRRLRFQNRSRKNGSVGSSFRFRFPVPEPSCLNWRPKGGRFFRVP